MRLPRDADMARAWSVPDLPDVRHRCDVLRAKRKSYNYWKGNGKVKQSSHCPVCGRFFAYSGKRMTCNAVCEAELREQSRNGDANTQP